MDILWGSILYTVVVTVVLTHTFTHTYTNIIPTPRQRRPSLIPFSLAI